MMAAIYAILLIAFVLDLLGRGRLAVCCLFLSFIICVWLFLWEIYSPEYGFRMPWLQVELGPIFAPLCTTANDLQKRRFEPPGPMSVLPP